MYIKESSRKEIEEKIAPMGDYVKMGYLSECLKKNLDFDTKKFVLLKLSALYENRKMYNEAGRCLRASADINTSAKNKIEEYLKSIELFVRGAHFNESDFSIKKTINILFPIIFNPPSNQSINMYKNIMKDPQDRHLFALCYETNTEIMVSLDKKHVLALKDKLKNIAIYAPVELLTELAKK